MAPYTRRVTPHGAVTYSDPNPPRFPYGNATAQEDSPQDIFTRWSADQISTHLNTRAFGANQRASAAGDSLTVPGAYEISLAVEDRNSAALSDIAERIEQAESLYPSAVRQRGLSKIVRGGDGRLFEVTPTSRRPVDIEGFNNPEDALDGGRPDVAATIVSMRSAGEANGTPIEKRPQDMTGEIVTSGASTQDNPAFESLMEMARRNDMNRVEIARGPDGIPLGEKIRSDIVRQKVEAVQAIVDQFPSGSVVSGGEIPGQITVMNGDGDMLEVSGADDSRLKPFLQTPEKPNIANIDMMDPDQVGGAMQRFVLEGLSQGLTWDDIYESPQMQFLKDQHKEAEKSQAEERKDLRSTLNEMLKQRATYLTSGVPVPSEMDDQIAPIWEKSMGTPYVRGPRQKISTAGKDDPSEKIVKSFANELDEINARMKVVGGFVTPTMLEKEPDAPELIELRALQSRRLQVEQKLSAARNQYRDSLLGLTKPATPEETEMAETETAEQFGISEEEFQEYVAAVMQAGFSYQDAVEAVTAELSKAQ